MKLKNYFTGLLTLFILLTVVSGLSLYPQAANYSVSTEINGVNILRRENYLVVYNSGDSTGTNLWGYEVIVQSGLVVALGGNDSPIPQEDNSFVVSGHGVKIDWLKENVSPGMKAYYTSSRVTFYKDSESDIINLKIQYDRLYDMFMTAKQEHAYIDYGYLSNRIEEVHQGYLVLKNNYDQNPEYDASLEVKALLNEIEEIVPLCTEVPIVDFRGVWLRPVQTTKKQVDDYVELLYSKGINTLFIETLYNSTMIMPMPEDSLFEQNPAWKDFDMLQAFIDSCHKRDMELHLWMPVYYVGHGSSNNYTRSVGYKKPEWLSLTNTGGSYSPQDSSRFVFLAPANPEVKEFLLSTYEYIIENYDIDGFQLDYIRYTSRDSVDFGYDKVTIDGFVAEYGVRPTFNTKASYWEDWVAYRARQVTDMVESVRRLIDRIKPGLTLSAAVGADFAQSYNYIYQDSELWLEKGLLDMINPMAYGAGQVELAKALIPNLNHCYAAIGLGSYVESHTAKDMLNHTLQTIRVKSEGAVFFEAVSYLSKGVGELLTQTLYKNSALPPTADPALAANIILRRAKDRINNIIVPHGSLSPSQGEVLSDALDQLAQKIDNKLWEQSVETLEMIKASLNELDSSVGQALTLDLDYAKKLLTNRIRSINLVSDVFDVEEIDNVLTAVNISSLPKGMAALKELLGGTVYIKDKTGKTPGENDPLGTGFIFYNDRYTYKIVIKGDVNGDGLIGSQDYLFAKRIFLNTLAADNYTVKAAAVTDGKQVFASDYLKIKRHFLGSYDIYSP